MISHPGIASSAIQSGVCANGYTVLHEEEKIKVSRENRHVHCVKLKVQ